jgi:hypothetical protein
MQQYEVGWQDLGQGIGVALGMAGRRVKTSKDKESERHDKKG